MESIIQAKRLFFRSFFLRASCPFLQAARVLLKENELDEYGLALLGLVANHPASDLETKHELEAALADLGLDPNDPRVLTRMEEDKSLDVDVNVNNLLVVFVEN